MSGAGQGLRNAGEEGGSPSFIIGLQQVRPLLKP